MVRIQSVQHKYGSKLLKYFGSYQTDFDGRASGCQLDSENTSTKAIFLYTPFHRSHFQPPLYLGQQLLPQVLVELLGDP